MVNKLTNTVKPLDEVDKINEIIDALDDVSVAVDNSTITKNASDQLQTVAVKDNRSGNAIKTWTGTKAQYDAIATKDATTLYNITDDTDVTLPLLELLYPIGSIYIGTMATCPLQVLGVGNWQLISTGIVKAGDIPVKGNGIALGLTDGIANYGAIVVSGRGLSGSTGSYGVSVGQTPSTENVGIKTQGVTTDATKSCIIGDTSSLELSCNIWERIS